MIQPGLTRMALAYRVTVALYSTHLHGKAALLAPGKVLPVAVPLAIRVD